MNGYGVQRSQSPIWGKSYKMYELEQTRENERRHKEHVDARLREKYPLSSINEPCSPIGEPHLGQCSNTTNAPCCDGICNNIATANDYPAYECKPNPVSGGRKRPANKKGASRWMSTGKKVRPQGCRYEKLIYKNGAGELRVRSVSVNKKGVRVVRYVKF